MSLTASRPRAQQTTSRDLDELDRCVAAGRSVINTACNRAGVDGAALWNTLERIYELKWQYRRLSGVGCDAFDREARRRGLDPADAADTLEIARDIEALPEIRDAYDQADTADMAARELDWAWRAEQQLVVEEIHAALAEHVALCETLPTLLRDAINDLTVPAALECAARWLPVAFIADEEQAHVAWAKWRRDQPTGGLRWWTRLFHPGTGSGAGIAIVDEIDGLFFPAPPQLLPPVGCQFVVSEDGGFLDATASYTDFPQPTVRHRPGIGSATFLHELCHWMEARLRPELATLQHTLLRLRQHADITVGLKFWSATHRIPAAVLDPYQECWYDYPFRQPRAFEVLSTTMAGLDEKSRDALHDPQMVAAMLGGLVVYA